MTSSRYSFGKLISPYTWSAVGMSDPPEFLSDKIHLIPLARSLQSRRLTEFLHQYKERPDLARPHRPSQKASDRDRYIGNVGFIDRRKVKCVPLRGCG